ncbi:hypothetical protein [Pseudotabrizicola sp.]|uniref:hypothetical protein n=1 Tax=Pseudotabrizicola sp. TaxID=2939647 RepID=UPI00271F5FFD|nr:hypothetical protein [Pseudotabrizicola sp.]MDO8882906.1 hypothetical protein [Pseudotabrizicola sp.]
MKLTLSPVRMDVPLTASVVGDVLTLNGEDFDFSPLPEGAVLPRDAVDCEWLASDVTRHAGRLEMTLILPHGANAPSDTLFPTPLDVEADGVLELPLYEIEEVCNVED